MREELKQDSIVDTAAQNKRPDVDLWGSVSEDKDPLDIDDIDEIEMVEDF